MKNFAEHVAKHIFMYNLPIKRRMKNREKLCGQKFGSEFKVQGLTAPSVYPRLQLLLCCKWGVVSICAS